MAKNKAPSYTPVRYSRGGGVEFENPVMTSITTLPPGAFDIGAGAPTILQPAGSLYSRSDGSTGSRLYFSTGAAWIAIL